MGQSTSHRGRAFCMPPRAPQPAFRGSAGAANARDYGADPAAGSVGCDHSETARVSDDHAHSRSVIGGMASRTSIRRAPPRTYSVRRPDRHIRSMTLRGIHAHTGRAFCNTQSPASAPRAVDLNGSAPTDGNLGGPLDCPVMGVPALPGEDLHSLASTRLASRTHCRPSITRRRRWCSRRPGRRSSSETCSIGRTLQDERPPQFSPAAPPQGALARAPLPEVAHGDGGAASRAARRRTR